jgi:hypothetical protein
MEAWPAGLRLGSTRDPRVSSGITPELSLEPSFKAGGRNKVWNEVFGVTPKTIRRRRMV